MGILIEVTSDNMSPRDWEALAAFVAVMQGKPALLASTAPAAIVAPTPAPLSPEAPAPVVVAEAPPAGNGAGGASPEGPEVTLPEAMLTPPVTTVPEGTEVDSAGLPWDARIHASTKTTVKDGSWTKRRNTDPALVATVEAELRKAMAAPAPGAETAPAAPPPPTGGPAIQVEGAPAAPPPPAAATAPPPPTEQPEPAAGDTPFTIFMRRVVAKQAAGTLTTSTTNEIAASLGLSSIRDLMVRQDLIPSFEALLP